MKSRFELPFWLNGPELEKIRAAAQSWWEKVENWLQWPLRQMDPERCHLAVLDLIAWERDITRFRREHETLYRKRVKFAFLNAVDAGSTAGLARILYRLGVGVVEVEERFPNRAWDEILIILSESQLSQNAELLTLIVQQYGRTCRRYSFVATAPSTLLAAVAEFNDDQLTVIGRL